MTVVLIRIPSLSSPFQVPGLQHTSRPCAPHPHSSPTLPPLPGGTPLLQECTWWLPPSQHSDHLLQAAAKPGGVYSAEGRTGASHEGKLTCSYKSNISSSFSFPPLLIFLPLFFLHLPPLFSSPPSSPPPLLHFQSFPIFPLYSWLCSAGTYMCVHVMCIFPKLLSTDSCTYPGSWHLDANDGSVYSQVSVHSRIPDPGNIQQMVSLSVWLRAKSKRVQSSPVDSSREILSTRFFYCV